MGEPDLVVVINDDRAFIIKSSDYRDANNAIELAMQKWHEWINGIKAIADSPDEISDWISSISVYEVM